ncbi:hypothetical protein Tco_0732792 [Tanacetum coccineum]
MSDMIACLNDHSYIPLNNEQNKPTQGHIGETSNEPTQAIRNEFEELYASANKELYPDCDYVTRLDFMEKFTHFRVKGYKLPLSYYEIKKTFKMIELGYESIHACVNDYFLFWGEDNKDKQLCLVCNTSRWKDNHTIGKKVPKKVLRYFSIIPRLQRFYKSSHIVKETTLHTIGKCTKPIKMQHPVNGRAWKTFDTCYLKFIEEPRNVRLGLAADGFNPFDNLIKDIDVYLRPLIDDLKDLSALKGIETIDVATGQKFNMRVMVLWTIDGFDFPARSSLSGWSGQDIMHIQKNVLESILNTLLMNDKSKDTTKARQDLKICAFEVSCGSAKTKTRSAQSLRLSIPSRQRAKKSCQFIKGVKLPDGFESNFKHKVTNNDTNITGVKSHDCYIMMQRLLPYGLHQYLPSTVATPIIELCSFFKLICSQTLMEADMLKTQSKVVDILCNLELIYPPTFFDIIIYLVIHLPLEALECRPIRPRWMYPFERFMKKLKNYILQRYINKDPGVSKSGELFALACGPTPSPISTNSCIVNDVRFVGHSQDQCRTTQNSGICLPGEKDEELYYG